MKRAVLLSYEGLGGISYLAELLSKWGFDDIVVLTDSSSYFQNITNIRLVVINSILEPNVLSKEAKKLKIGPHNKIPFICVADRLTFTYIEACKSLGLFEDNDLNIPFNGILTSRLKPVCRAEWNNALNYSKFAPTRFLVLHEQIDKKIIYDFVNNRTNQENNYYLKPIAGMGSERVSKICINQSNKNTLLEIMEKAQSIREYYKKNLPKNEYEKTVYVNSLTYHLYKDVLLEEEIIGNEYTVDGYIYEDEISCIVQQKETRYIGSFIGDGLITSPPEENRRIAPIIQSSKFLQSSSCKVKLDDFNSLMKHAMKVINLNNWVFHAEVVEDVNGKIGIIEVNPRPAGGLLSISAGLHLGTSIFEYLLILHLKKTPTLGENKNWITGQFPIYAEDVGTITSINGEKKVQDMEFVEKIVVIAKIGDEITDINKENYLAFVCIYAPNHELVRNIESEVRAILSFKIEG